ncbi:hypothetical protein [Taibaiella koreensis]|uniref:hypothetical protein n=1 Tax=Taibaiella koreensis TaxID=1268548 RepID=UPI001F096030|nr:hypothetical protein [Taibaiella koreensis]
MFLIYLCLVNATRMYQTLIFYHSIVRWLVLAALLYGVFRAGTGYVSGRPFTRTDNAVRHWTATIAHVQLLIGMLLYWRSPVIHYFWKHFDTAREDNDTMFFGTIHVLMMLTAIVIVTIGSALAKRRTEARAQFRTMLIWFSLALLLILLAIPWPFSPLAHRPYIR